jgi:hypothetical protein
MRRSRKISNYFNMIEKTCTKCGETKPLSEFHIDKKATGGHSLRCKACACAASRRWVAANRERNKSNCARWQRTNVERARATSKRWYEAHPEHNLNNARKYRERHPDVILQRRREWKKNHPIEWLEHKARWRKNNVEKIRESIRRARRSNPAKFADRARQRRAHKHGTINDLTPQQWEVIKAAFDQRCAYCGRNDLPLTQDHVIPLSKGGPHTASNIVPACRPCNAKKCDREPLPMVQQPLKNIA